MIQPAAISVRTRNTNLIITQLHHAATVTGGAQRTCLVTEFHFFQ
jgi:hypothetical protein